MSDNVEITPGTGVKVAADEAPYSGDTAEFQIVQLAVVTGTEGAKTATKLPADPVAGLKVDLGADNDVTVATIGATTDAAITDGSAGTNAAKLRGLNLLLGLIVDQVNGWSRSEINELHYSEDSVKVLGEDVTPYSEIVTVNTLTELVAAPAVGTHLVVKFFSYQLRENVSTTASLRAGASVTDYYPYDLDFTTMPLVGKKLNPDGWPLPSATALNAKLSAAPATNGVRYVIEYVTRPD